MACPAYTAPSRTKRTVIQIALEQTPGCTRSSELEILPLYENLNPLQVNGESIPLTRARNGLGPEGFAVGIVTYALSGSVYMVGSGFSNIPPVWTRLLRVGGFKETRYTLNSGAPLVSFELSTGTPGAGDTVITPSTAAGALTLLGVYKYGIGRVAQDATIEEQLSIDGTNTITLATTENTVTIDWGVQTCVTLTAAAADKVRIYRTKAGGSTYYFLAEVNANTTTSYVDLISDDELVDPAPTQSGTLTGVVWTPEFETHDTLSVFSFLDSWKYPAVGCRGSIAFAGDAGQLMRGDFELQGVYAAPTATANPAVTSVPVSPPRIAGIGCTITPAGVSAITPIIKSIGINPGANITRRLDANATEVLKEFGIYNEFDPRITMQVEANGTDEWVQWYKAAKKFRIQLTHTDGSGLPGTRFQIIGGGSVAYNADPATPTGTTAQLSAPPVFDDVEGIRVVNLDFQLAEDDSGSTTDGTFLYIRHY